LRSRNEDEREKCGNSANLPPSFRTRRAGSNLASVLALTDEGLARLAIAATAVAPRARAMARADRPQARPAPARRNTRQARWRAAPDRADYCQRGSTCCWSAGSLYASMKPRVPPVSPCPSRRATSRTFAAMTCATSRTQPSSTFASAWVGSVSGSSNGIQQRN